VYLGGFDKSTTEAEIKKLFTGYLDFHMPIKKETNLNLGCAFIKYGTEEEAAKAIKAVEGKEVKGRKLHAENAFFPS